MRPVLVENDALRLLKSYLSTARGYHETAGVELGLAMVLHICDLIALAFGATQDGAELAGRRGLCRPARRHEEAHARASR